MTMKPMPTVDQIPAHEVFFLFCATPCAAGDEVVAVAVLMPGS